MPHPLFRLGNRLALCASMVREGTKLADIGTDHAYLPIWLARKGRISSAIAADVKPLPLRSAEQNIRRYHVEEQITTRLSDGLRALSPDEAGDIVLAGMGGELIIRLIGEAPWLKAGDKRLILQPMTSAEELRRFLEREGFAILREQAAEEDGHVYSVMLVEYCPAQAGGGELYPYIGKLDGSTPESRAYIAKCARRLSKKAQGMRLSGNAEEASSLQMILEKLQQLCETNNEKGGLVMATVGQFYDFIDAFAPFHTAMGFDNPGLLVGARDTEVRSVLFALDITPQVVREAAEMGAQLIVSHHPVIFHPLKSLSPDSAPYLLAQYGIAAICPYQSGYGAGRGEHLLGGAVTAQKRADAQGIRAQRPAGGPDRGDRPSLHAGRICCVCKRCVGVRRPKICERGQDHHHCGPLWGSWGGSHAGCCRTGGAGDGHRGHEAQPASRCGGYGDHAGGRRPFLHRGRGDCAADGAASEPFPGGKNGQVRTGAQPGPIPLIPCRR